MGMPMGVAEMKTAIVVLVVVGSLALAGGDVSHEGVIKQMLGIQDKITSTLASVKDQASADAAKPELQKSAKEWATLRGQAEKLPPPSQMEKERLEKEFKSKLEDAQKKLYAEVIRLRKVEGGTAAVKEIRSVLDKKVK